MIDKRHVIRMKVPFPDVKSGLATQAHMYVCLDNADEKRFVACQTFKPYHLKSGSKPLQRICEEPDINRNPFLKTSLIDCDKGFSFQGVNFPLALVTPKRDKVCEDLFYNIQNKIEHDSFTYTYPDINAFLSCNPKVDIVS
ncbi:hypothetical protein E2R51_02395 [Jeotgalibacillus sp. S-D1]|uniref:hypothetical protein n=1 Tax=Jeotgalibacillus sp. S-D1 TaxID=2552189 RepID=UPI001059F7EF|nr:hypothetical protein [Jeotgalibacillus sp. S-D1]TDL34587.1 hypothetical protein E2R51_02395 [Jeotgalibacillus sp. S-D1]